VRSPVDGDGPMPSSQRPAIVRGGFRSRIDRGLASSLQDWVVVEAQGPSSPWTSLRPTATIIPPQGWKIHVSAYLWTADAVLDAVLPVVAQFGVPCKVVGSSGLLRSLNSGDGGLPQIGKFITLYPDPDEVVQLVAALERATRDVGGPIIATDRRIRGSVVVQYRYGSFGAELLQTALGDVCSLMRSPTGALVPDRRRSGDATPPWVVDPLEDRRPPDDEQGDVPRRFVAVRPLYRSARTTVTLVLDTTALHVGAAKVYSAVAELTAGGATRRMQFERAALNDALVTGTPVPRPLFFREGTVHSPDALLVMDIPAGETIEHLVARTFGRGFELPVSVAIAIGIHLVDAVAQLHAAGVSHNDLKSANVFVDDDRVTLIDLDSSERLGQRRRYPHTVTPGYAAPDRDPDTARETDDVYAIGALLYFLLTGAEPSRAPRPESLLERPVRLLNPRVPPATGAIVDRCLSTDRLALRDLRHHLERALEPGSESPGSPYRVDVDERGKAPPYTELVRDAVDAICRSAACADGEPGRRWTSRHRLGKGQVLRDVNAGVAGVLIALAEGLATCRHPGWCDVLAGGAEWLEWSRPLPGPDRPGLYVGEMGVAIALIKAGTALGDSAITSAGTDRSRRVARSPFTSPDVFHGTAGRLLGHLVVWQLTADDEDLDAARAAADHLVRTAVRTPGRRAWPIPDGFDGLSGVTFLGYAHGAAGIADALLYLAEADNDDRYLNVGAEALQWVLDHAQTGDDGAVRWPVKPGGKAHPAMWCHGAGGIGTTLLHASRLIDDDRLLTYAYQAAIAVGSIRWCQTSLCHGLAGSIAFLADARQQIDDPRLTGALEDAVHLLLAFRDVGGGYVTDAPRVVSPDLMVGYGGVVVALCRAADPRRADPIRPACVGPRAPVADSTHLLRR
jgi:hypothetical protein